MGKRDKQAAIELMEKAWASRRETMTSPPESKQQLQKKMDEVYQYLIEAVAICREVGAQRELVHALRKLGHVEQEMGRNNVTRALYEEAVTISRAEGDTLLLAHSVRHLGDIHRHAGRAVDAAACYDEALALYRNQEQPPKLDLANVIRPMAILKEDAGVVNEAKKLWQEARDLYAAVKVQEGVDECSQHLARLGA
ncbi:tetratricopeptide repeat protein [bacterium]|nr:tetratricopeptide repeat protein [bacterium]